ncbi:MAG: glycosyltransferase, partial [Candidatus Margulisbacteria bacterium]|nr:glycosyltransferase [Candidatus Margulisiibacteriota bacterium]
AMEIISRKRNDIKMVFIGTKQPNLDVSTPNSVQLTIDLSKKYGLFGKSIFFIDWVPYKERANYLLESDLGIVNHMDSLETHFAWRTKVLDFLWADLPIIATLGDSMADIIKENHLGKTIPPQSPEAQAEAILALLDNNEEYSQIKNNIAKFKASFYWDNVVQPIERYIAALK